VTAKDLARSRIDAAADQLLELSHRIHAHPRDRLGGTPGRRLLDLFLANARDLGRPFTDSGVGARMNRASTDMGNISLRLPAIHPYLGIDSLPAVNHQPEFAAHCAGPAADRAVLDGAIALAATVIDAATRDNVRDRLLYSPAPDAHDTIGTSIEQN